LENVPGGEIFMPGFLGIRSDHLFVVDLSGGRIVVLDEGGQFLREMKPDDPTFKGFNAVAVDGGGSVYGLDTLAGQVYQFSPDGKFQMKFGKRGPGPDQFEFPTALTVGGKGLVYVVDQHRGTILVFNRKGRFQTHFAAKGWEEGKVYYPAAIAVDGNGRAFVADRNNNRVQVFVPSEK
jgi:sugar lactone lactonase YvrE